MSVKRKGISIFDIDGPLRSGGIALWPEFLRQKGLFREDSLKRVRKDLQKAEAGKISYRQFAIDILNHMAEGLQGQKPADVKKAAVEFVNKPELMQLHPYAIELVERMNQRGISVAITGQPHELAEAFMKVLPFHMSVGTEFEVKKGKYTGRVKRNMALRKDDFLKELRRHKQYWKGISYGFADRVTDRRMLEHATKPIALNPDSKMEKLAKKTRLDNIKRKSYFTKNPKKMK